MQAQPAVAKTEPAGAKTTAISPQGPQTRCYICGKPEIASVCHHCGRPMCSSHLPARASNVRIWAREFAELDLPADTAPGEVGIHCPDCAHKIWSRTFFFLGIAALILGLSLVIPTHDLLSLALAIALGCVLSLAVVAFMHLKKISLAPVKHPLPLLPAFGPPRVSETLRGKIDPQYPQGSGRPSVEYLSSGGAVTINASFSHADRERLERYRRKFAAAAPGPVEFHAGFAVLRGPAHLAWTQTDIKMAPGATIIPLIGQLDQLPYFSDAAGKARDWRITQNYDLPAAAELGDFPLGIVPRLAQSGGQQALDLEVQWGVPHFASSNLKIDQIQSLVLHIPDNWREIESAMNVHIIGEDETTGRKLTWQGVSLSAEDLILQRHIFTLHFEKHIDPLTPIWGEVKIAFKGSLSGIEGLDLFYPLGQKIEGLSSRGVDTVISAEFELSLERIPLQFRRSVPDPQKDPNRPVVATFSDVIPDFTTVALLTNVLDDQGFEVEAMRETPPEPIEGETGMIYRWEIAGRHYLGVLPVTYTLDLSGESRHMEDGSPAQASTRVRVQVTGQYTLSQQKWPLKGKSAGPSPEQQIVDVWDALHQLVQNTMQNIKTT